MGKFAKVELFCEFYEADGDVNDKDSLDNSGSNETTQKVLALMVWLRQNFQKNLGGQKFQIFEIENLCFSISSDLGEI